MYKILVIFIMNACLAEQRLYRFRNKRIPNADDDYREDNADDERTDLRDMRDMRNNNDGPFGSQTYDLDGGPRYRFNRGPPYGLYNQYNPAQQSLYLQPQQQQQYQPQPQQSHLPTQQPQSLDGGRGNGWTRPAYGWARPAPSSAWSLGFPFNLFALGSHRPGPEWGWGGNRWGLFF